MARENATYRASEILDKKSDYNTLIMMYDFDKIIDRTGSGDIKHMDLKAVFGSTELIPMWIADMEWATPDFITDALKARLEHSLFGYTKTPPNYWSAISKWIRDHHQWDVKEEWISFIPGIVKGIGMAIYALLEKDDKVIVQPPIYHPFYLVPQGEQHEVVWNPLKERHNADGKLVGYDMDFDNLEQVCDSNCRMLILANPHNPAGIVWSKETLQQLAHFAVTHNLIVISDEIHCDMALFGNKHIPFAYVSKEAAQCSITFSAPSKTFNMSGIVSSWAVVPNEELRKKFYGWMAAGELNEEHLFAPIATMAAFEHGEEWRKQMIKYLEGNIEFVMEYCKNNIPLICPVCPQAGFLIWLDCRALNLSQKELKDLFVKKAHLALNDGQIFGKKEGFGFMRMNVGSPRSIINEALDRLKTAING